MRDNGGWVGIPTPAKHLEGYQRTLADGHLTVLFGRERDVRGRTWWHLSISHRSNENSPKPGRQVAQEEIKDARYRFLPNDILMCEMWPPAQFLTSEHPTTRHLWQMPIEFAD